MVIEAFGVFYSRIHKLTIFVYKPWFTWSSDNYSLIVILFNLQVETVVKLSIYNKLAFINRTIDGS